MGESSYSKILSGSFWGIASVVFDSIAKFITIPLLIGYYGKADYGLIALAFSLNVYLRLLDMGVGIGAVRYLSMWLAKNEKDKIIKASQSSIVFYGGLGAINTTILIVVGIYADHIFELQPDQINVFKWMMFILAASTIINWLSYIVKQLLTANEDLAWINQMTLITSTLTFGTAIITIGLKLTLPVYFTLYIISTLFILPLNIYRLRKTDISPWKLIKPKWHYPVFKEILMYSLAIFAMGIFQFSATNLRPVLLGAFAPQGVSVVTDYRVIETICLFVMTLGGVFFQVLLPASSKNVALGDTKKTEFLVYSGTKYVSLFLALIIFGLVINAKSLLDIYVGEEFLYLTVWLVFWLLTLLELHVAPVSSLILSTGRTRPLVYSAALGFIASASLTILLAPVYNVGAAVIGYLVHILIQVGFSYFYYIPYILKLDGKRIFVNSFLPSTLLAAVSGIGVIMINKLFVIDSDLLKIIFRSVLFMMFYGLLCYKLILKPEELQYILQRLKKLANGRNNNGS
ncbi:MAG: hypothetical protein JXR31_02490 [Prolixibacteraceae bacterium]|nr:hypothetical protein [Prolixibacteraceae bacterium]MBN2773091.1 hypothetical protein [Prolixibacteraceae bacterium]